MNSKQKIMELISNSMEMQDCGATAESVVLKRSPELEPGSEPFYAEVLREMGNQFVNGLRR